MLELPGTGVDVGLIGGKECHMDWLKGRRERQAEEQRERDESNRSRAKAARAYQEEVVEDMGVVAFQRDGTIRLNVNDAAEKKLAIKELRLKKKELTAAKRELSAEIAAIRAEFRSKVAGRHSTVGLGRGTGGRMIRAGIQAKRRGERMQVDDAIVPVERERNVIDSQMIAIDRAIARLEARPD